VAIEWRTRVERPFRFADLTARTEAVLLALLGLAPGTLRVEAMAPVREWKTRRPIHAPEAGRSRLRALRGPGTPDAEIVLAIRERDTAVDVAFYDRDATHDVGEAPRCVVSTDLVRDRLAYVLGIATVIAATELGGGPVSDEALRLTNQDTGSPEGLLAVLQVPGPPGIGLEEAVAAFLARTRGGDPWPSDPPIPE